MKDEEMILLEKMLGRPPTTAEVEAVELARKYMPGNPFKEGSIRWKAWQRGSGETMKGVGEMLADSWRPVLED